MDGYTNGQELTDAYNDAQAVITLLFNTREAVKQKFEQEISSLQRVKRDRMWAIERYFNAQIRAVEAQADAVKSEIDAEIGDEKAIINNIEAIKTMVSNRGNAARRCVQSELEYRLPYKGMFPVLHFQTICEGPAITLYAVISKNSRPTNKYSLWVVGNAIKLPRDYYHKEIYYVKEHSGPTYQVEVKVASSEKELVRYIEKNVLALNANSKVLKEIRCVKAGAESYYNDVLRFAHLNISDFEGIKAE